MFHQNHNLRPNARFQAKSPRRTLRETLRESSALENSARILLKQSSFCSSMAVGLCFV
jgi:hypothetical protein